MKPRNKDQKLTEGQGQARKPRFHIEKLEERIAPHHKAGHYNGGGDGPGGGPKSCPDGYIRFRGYCTT